MKSIKFRRPYYKANGEFSHFSFFEITPDHNVHVTNLPKSLGVPREDELTSDIQSKDGIFISVGDVIRYKTPYRTTQTHEGDNIPNGSYTEPMEAGIKVHEGKVIFVNGCFMIEGDPNHSFDSPYPIYWSITEWDLECIKESISYGRPDRFTFDDPEEGDLQYLIELAEVKDSDELIKFFNGFEIIGNIHQNPDMYE